MIEPSDSHTEISTGAPELSMVRAVDMCMEEPSGISEIELVIEDASSQRSIHKRTVCRFSPSELNLVEFFVGVILLLS